MGEAPENPRRPASKSIRTLKVYKKFTRLYDYLKESGYEIVFKPTVQDRKGEVKGNVDAELVLHCAKIEYDNYDKAIIVSGDGDFHCLLEFLFENSKLKALLIPNREGYSILLRKFRKNTFFMDYLEKKIKKGVLPEGQNLQDVSPS